jgi:two-component system response regulator FixJ
MGGQDMVYVVDDDASVRKSMAWMFRMAGLLCETFESGDEFLRQADATRPTCLVLDMHLPGMGGVEVLRQLQGRPDLAMPVIIVTGKGDVPTAVQCLKMGVHDFLEKPVDHDVMLAKIRECHAADAARRADDAEHADARSRLRQLTERERDVMQLICTGHSTKQIAARLGISDKTVSVHRWHLMKKLQAGSATEVVHIAHRAHAA